MKQWFDRENVRVVVFSEFDSWALVTLLVFKILGARCYFLRVVDRGFLVPWSLRNGYIKPLCLETLRNVPTTEASFDEPGRCALRALDRLRLSRIWKYLDDMHDPHMRVSESLKISLHRSRLGDSNDFFSIISFLRANDAPKKWVVPSSLREQELLREVDLDCYCSSAHLERGPTSGRRGSVP